MTRPKLLSNFCKWKFWTPNVFTSFPNWERWNWKQKCYFRWGKTNRRKLAKEVTIFAALSTRQQIYFLNSKSKWVHTYGNKKLIWIAMTISMKLVASFIKLKDFSLIWPNFFKVLDYNITMCSTFMVFGISQSLHGFLAGIFNMIKPLFIFSHGFSPFESRCFGRFTFRSISTVVGFGNLGMVRDILPDFPCMRCNVRVNEMLLRW